MERLIQAVLAALARNDFPAVAIFPSDDLAGSKAALARLLLRWGMPQRQ